MSGKSVETATPVIGGAKKPRVRKRVVLIPLLVASLIPVGWGAGIAAGPLVDSLKVKSDLVAAAEKVEASKDPSTGEYASPVFIQKKYASSVGKIPEGSFGPVEVSDESELSFTKVGGGHFCLMGASNGIYFDDTRYYSSKTGEVSRSEESCLNLDGDADTYKCLPETKDTLVENDYYLEPPALREVMQKRNVKLDNLPALENPDDYTSDGIPAYYTPEMEAIDKWFEKEPAVKELRDRISNSADDTEMSGIASVLSFYEVMLREEVGMSTPEFTAREDAFAAYQNAVGDESTYDESGAMIPSKKKEVEKLYAAAVQASDDYVNVLCN